MPVGFRLQSHDYADSLTRTRPSYPRPRTPHVSFFCRQHISSGTHHDTRIRGKLSRGNAQHNAVRRVGHRIGHRIAHPMGQRGIAPERATQIQNALIRQNYLTGSPSGQWDSN